MPYVMPAMNVPHVMRVPVPVMGMPVPVMGMPVPGPSPVPVVPIPFRVSRRRPVVVHHSPVMAPSPPIMPSAVMADVPDVMPATVVNHLGCLGRLARR